MSQTKTIKASIIIVNYNNAQYLKKSLETALNQTYENKEIIVIDDMSNDNSVEVIKKFNDNRIKYYRNSIKVPLYTARNQAIKVSTGDLIAFLDCDDWWEKNYIS